MEFGLQPQETELKMWENLGSRNHTSGFYCYIFLEKTSMLINSKVWGKFKKKGGGWGVPSDTSNGTDCSKYFMQMEILVEKKKLSFTNYHIL